MSDIPELPPPGTVSEPVAWLSPATSAGSMSSDRANKRRGQQLFSYGLAAIVTGVLFYTYTANVADPLHLYLGQLIMVLATVPALMWAKRARYGLPLFEVFMLTGINTYAIPLLSGHQQLALYTDEVVTTAAIAVVIFQSLAILVYFSLKTRPKRSPFWRDEIISGDVSKVLGYGMIVTTAYTIISQFTNWIPEYLQGPVRAASYGIGIIATFVQARRWGTGDLPQAERIALAVLITLQIIFNFVALYLVQGISILLLALLGYVSGSKKLPLFALAVALPVIGLLHNGKSAMRTKYWEQRAPPPTITEIPAYFEEWVGYGLDPENTKARTKESNRLLERSSLLHMLCLVIANTPDKFDYLYGETYLQIPGQFVPRIFWPEKPLGHISTYTLAIHYGLQTEEGTFKTTIAFGMLTEAYANFGLYGVGLLALFLSGLFNKFSAWSAESPILSYPGMIMVVLMAWSFQTELTLSIWLSSLFQACVTVIGVPLALRSVLK